jgi:catechol 2,3-dioxygenase-like lactoylglutathione lyase family enzyme
MAGLSMNRSIFRAAALLWWSVLLPQGLSAQDNPLGLRVHHITAAVTDIDRAVKWYEGMLGFKVASRGSRQDGAFRFAELEIPGFGVALVQAAGLKATPLAQPAGIAPDWMHIVFAVADPDATYRLLKQRGAVVTTRANAPAGPVQTFLVYDSEGNEIEIVASPR